MKYTACDAWHVQEKFWIAQAAQVECVCVCVHECMHVFVCVCMCYNEFTVFAVVSLMCHRRSSCMCTYMCILCWSFCACAWNDLSHKTPLPDLPRCTQYLPHSSFQQNHVHTQHIYCTLHSSDCKGYIKLWYCIHIRRLTVYKSIQTQNTYIRII